jgi:hypothetical protein
MWLRASSPDSSVARCTLDPARQETLAGDPLPRPNTQHQAFVFTIIINNIFGPVDQTIRVSAFRQSESCFLA